MALRVFLFLSPNFVVKNVEEDWSQCKMSAPWKCQRFIPVNQDLKFRTSMQATGAHELF